jgi:hypothetical protein
MLPPFENTVIFSPANPVAAAQQTERGVHPGEISTVNVYYMAMVRTKDTNSLGHGK